MSGFLEVSVKGGGAAFIDASLVRGCARHPKLQAWDASNAELNLMVFLGDNRELEIFGPSQLEFLVLCDRIRRASKNADQITLVPRESYTVDVIKAPHGYDIQIRYLVEP